MFSLYFLLRTLLYPFIVYVLPFFSKGVKKRLLFERRYPLEFEKGQDGEFDYAFEISSEGELEQVRVLIDEALKAHKRIQILFCSPSVESQCLKIQRDFPSLVQIATVPLVNFHPFFNNPSHWLRSKNFVMCRYDFFPELIHFGRQRRTHFILLSGSLKNYERKSRIEKRYLGWCYRSFNLVIAANDREKRRFEKEFPLLSDKVFSFDFRVSQIINRLSVKDETLKDKFPHFLVFLKLLESVKKEKRFVFGSLWEHELSMFEKFDNSMVKDSLFVIVPHKLDSDNLGRIKSFFSSKSIPLFEVSKETTMNSLEEDIQRFSEQGGIWLFNLKGVLCELYSLFSKAYVGGGFGDSIHSVLEPFCAGAEVVCGPKTYRSSEFDYIQDENPQSITSVNLLEDILNTMVSQRDHFQKVDFHKGQLKRQAYILEKLGLKEKASVEGLENA